MVRSVHRAFRILDALGERGAMKMSDISRELRMPKSTLHEIINTLEEIGIVAKDSERVTYSLGIRLFELGQVAQENLEVTRVSRPVIERLNKQFDETVHVTVLEDDEVLYIDCFESTKRLRTYSVIGVRAPLHCTAVGKAILAYLPETEVERIVAERGLPHFTATTITDRARLDEERENTRSRGYSIDDAEHEPGVRCVGAPIFDHRGKVFASISLSGPDQRLTHEMVGELGTTVRQAADEISRRLGYRQPRAATRAGTAYRE